MSEPKPAPPSKRKNLSKSQALVVMLTGAILLAQAFFVPTETGSSAHTIKVVVALIGLVVLFVGAYLRPLKASPEGK